MNVNSLMKPIGARGEFHSWLGFKPGSSGTRPDQAKSQFTSIVTTPHNIVSDEHEKCFTALPYYSPSDDELRFNTSDPDCDGAGAEVAAGRILEPQ
jgi:hypothetical protein